MGARRFFSLLAGLGIISVPKSQASRPREPEMSSPQDVKRFLGGAVRYAPGGEG